MYSESDLQKILIAQDNPLDVIGKIYSQMTDKDKNSAKNNLTAYSRFLKNYAIIEAAARSLEFEFIPASITGDKPKDVESILAVQKVIHAEYHIRIEQVTLNKSFNEFEDFKNQALSAFSTPSTYEFSEADFDRIQRLINELRDLITKTDEIEDEDYRHRLLSKLEKFQKELHKRLSDLHRLWGGMIEFGMVLGQMGTHAIPFFKRLREIKELVTGVQARGLNLPSSTPFFLPANEGQDTA